MKELTLDSIYVRFEQTFMRSSKLKRVKVKELIWIFTVRLVNYSFSRLQLDNLPRVNSLITANTKINEINYKISRGNNNASLIIKIKKNILKVVFLNKILLNQKLNKKLLLYRYIKKLIHKCRGTKI